VAAGTGTAALGAETTAVADGRDEVAESLPDATAALLVEAAAGKLVATVEGDLTNVFDPS
jgi:hypothetical protein